MIRVIVVDDHNLVRHGFCQMLAKASDIEIVGDVESGEKALKMAELLQPDVVLMDIQMPGLGGLEATRRIRKSFPEIQVVILSSAKSEPFPEQTRDAGAISFLSKCCSQEELAKAVRDASIGQSYISADIAQSLALSKLDGHRRGSALNMLSKREMEVLLLTVQGKRNKEVAVALHLSEKTVSTYKQRLYEKLAVNNDVELTLFALRHKLVEVI